MNAQALNTTQVHSEQRMRLSVFDRVSAGLTAALMIVGCFTLILFAAWLDSDRQGRWEVIPPVVIGTGEITPVVNDTWNDSLEVEVTELPELQQMELLENLQAVVELSEESTIFAESIQARNQRYDIGIPGKYYDYIARRYSGTRVRWDVDLTARDLESYAGSLRSMGIQICAINRTNNQVYFLSDPGSDTAKLAESDKATEKVRQTKLFGHKSVNLEKWDRQLLQRAGLDASDFVVGQIYPTELVFELRKLEIEKCQAAGRELKNIWSTAFGIRESGDDLELEIVSQVYADEIYKY